jgi:SAM-dependent methyltransferase
MMPAPIHKSDPRSPERIREHYLIEKELAARLRNATKRERQSLYTVVYDELFRRVPDHPQLALKTDEQTRRRLVAERVRLLSRYLRSNSTYLEIGPGDCALAIAVAQRVRQVFAVDVSTEIAAGVALPNNVALAISDGCSIPVPDGSVDVAYSDQLMEHLHPDDAREQLANIYRALAPGGIYVCITPNRLSGPHDVSRYFDEVATGFHLQEYTARELAAMFRAAGFRKLVALVGARGSHVAVPVLFLEGIEVLLTRLPRRLGKTLARGLPLRLILGVKLMARK